MLIFYQSHICSTGITTENESMGGFLTCLPLIMMAVHPQYQSG